MYNWEGLLTYNYVITETSIKEYNFMYHDYGMNNVTNYT